MPDTLHRFSNTAWLATASNHELGFWVGSFNSTYELYTLYKNSAHEPNASICPVIFLPKDIVVELPSEEKDGLSPKNALKISLA